MENIENREQNEISFTSNSAINEYLIATSKWAKFLAIMGYIGMGILILIAIFMMFGLSLLSKVSGMGFPMIMMGFVYIVIAVIYYFPVNYLYKFSVRIKKGLNSNDLPTIASGFRNLKSLFKFMGILTIVIISIYGLLMIIAVPAMLFFKHQY
jgi:hypothetical protein